jgi:transposase
MPTKTSSAVSKRRSSALVTPPATRDRRRVPTAGDRAERRSGGKLADFSPAGFPAGAPKRSKGANETGAKEKSTMRTIALDLGTKVIAYCEVAGGEVLQRGTVSSLGGLEPMLGSKATPARVAIEACREAWFVHARLTEWGNEVLLVDTTRSRQLGIGQHRRKNDRIDAEVLARALERGHIPVAHLLSRHRQELRRQLSVRRALVETRAQYVTTMRGIGREHGQVLPSCDAEEFVNRMRSARIGDDLRQVLEPLLLTVDGLQLQLARVEQRLDELSAQEPVVAQLTTLPGVGRIVAASFVSVIDDARRFRHSHQVESYLGLVPSENSSGGKVRLGGISKRGNSYLRALLVQAAWVILRLPSCGDPLQMWGREVVKRRGNRIGVIAVARRLAGILWAMWRDGTVYDAAMAAKSGARGLRAAAQSTEQRAAALERAAKKIRRPKPRPAAEVTNSP